MNKPIIYLFGEQFFIRKKERELIGYLMQILHFYLVAYTLAWQGDEETQHTR